MTTRLTGIWDFASSCLFDILVVQWNRMCEFRQMKLYIASALLISLIRSIELIAGVTQSNRKKYSCWKPVQYSLLFYKLLIVKYNVLSGWSLCLSALKKTLKDDNSKSIFPYHEKCYYLYNWSTGLESLWSGACRADYSALCKVLNHSVNVTENLIL